MTDKEIIIDGKECRYWFRPNPSDYRKCSLRGKNDNCDEINDCFIKELLGKLAHKEQECEKYKQTLIEIIRFLKEDKKFARYSGYPIVLTSIVIEEIEKILKENDIKINECEEEN